MNTIRDKFLTEAMGECWHTFTPSWSNYCLKCHTIGTKGEKLSVWVEDRKQINNFSTWEGFGKLLTWLLAQPWLYQFTQYVHGKDTCLLDQYNCIWDLWTDFLREYAKPVILADLVHEYLKYNHKEV